ncbi:RNA-directed DNA polymerase, eukaryota, Reverse transcriptase zinc-binding domain protein [Artemisia annua]|uniref:RNA-directed DNA polymerase, eukaryota, Reverse transcriptase zinc-binding domain protein n=1 Tax=Artemisia annua TaxID=35608 RepID=A0A2U1NYC7_ARTAN|nr:RNA-directed DNA polymerase, eukaryota, Reverse transcriptase zinc-binding domain protein [Artemisia annua]
MSWIAWKKVCSSKSCCGLGIGNLYASNLAMLTKWWWIFHSENNSLWKNIVTSIHGTTGGYYCANNVSTPLSPWKNIIGLDKPLSCVNSPLKSIFTRRVGNGSTFCFWTDHWIGENNLQTLFPRLFSLDRNKQCLIQDICSPTNGSLPFNFNWRRHISNGTETVQFDGLIDMLRGFTLSSTPDCWDCPLNPSKTFIVSTLRKSIKMHFSPLKHTLTTTN